MLGLFHKAPRRAAPPARLRPRLFLERLETRDCPSTLTMGVTYGQQGSITLSGTLTDEGPTNGVTVQISGVASGSTTTDANGNYTITLTAGALGTAKAATADGKSNVASVMLNWTAPVIQNFACVELPNHWFTFTGKVIGPDAGGLTVSFGGAPESLQNQSTTTAADGTFSFTIQLNGTVDDNGIASAVVTNRWGQTSACAYCDVYQTCATVANSKAWDQ
jgi:hypothetical protein